MHYTVFICSVVRKKYTNRHSVVLCVFAAAGNAWNAKLKQSALSLQYYGTGAACISDGGAQMQVGGGCGSGGNNKYVDNRLVAAAATASN